MNLRKSFSSAVLVVLNYSVFAFCWSAYGVCWALWHLPHGTAALVRKVGPPICAGLASMLITGGMALVWLLLSVPDVIGFLRDGRALLRVAHQVWANTASYATATAAALGSLVLVAWQILQ